MPSVDIFAGGLRTKMRETDGQNSAPGYHSKSKRRSVRFRNHAFDEWGGGHMRLMKDEKYD